MSLLAKGQMHRHTAVEAWGFTNFLLVVTGIGVAAPAGGGTQKVEICHIPPGNPENFHTITISASALPAHLAHGDFPGPCENNCTLFTTACDDGIPCTADLCDTATGQCLPPTPTGCNDDNPCTADSCDAGTGFCVNTPAPGGPCDDGDYCTEPDTCTSTGCCAGTAIPGCCRSDEDCSDFNPCTVDSCNGATHACGHTAVSCDDGNACTVDACNQTDGLCVHAPVLCPQCQSCGSSGTCVADDSQTCSNGNACTQNDSCQAGSCVGSTPVVCVALDHCHAGGTCNTGTGVCTNPGKPDGTACSDGSACTTGDVCITGVCGGTTVNCAALDQCHGAGICNSATGACSNPELNGAACSDGDAGTCDDICVGGICTGLVENCLISCDGAPEGATCDDNEPCTGPDHCAGGVCHTQPCFPLIFCASTSCSSECGVDFCSQPFTGEPFSIACGLCLQSNCVGELSFCNLP